MKQNVSVHFVSAMKNVNCTHLRKMAAVESILFSKPLQEALGNSPQNSQMKCNIVLKILKILFLTKKRGGGLGDMFPVHLHLFFMVRHPRIYQSLFELYLHPNHLEGLLKHRLLGTIHSPSTSDSLLGQEQDPRICISNKLGTTLREPLCYLMHLVISCWQ